MDRCEQNLIKRVKHRERCAQRELYDLYADRLLSISLRYVGRYDIAEDILHDVFIKIFRAIDGFTYRGEGSLRAWMEKIVVNSSLEWLRVQKKLDLVSFSDDSLANIAAEADPTFEDVQRVPQSEILKFIAQLPHGYRTVFNLFTIEGYCHREIALQLKINEKSSSSQLLRAKRLLATMINKYLEDNE
ncbi:MAG: sigma-70 family RNA polymerase sigma factor [Rikenellaceae bacterium]